MHQCQPDALPPSGPYDILHKVGRDIRRRDLQRLARSSSSCSVLPDADRAFCRPAQASAKNIFNS
jgi:hypothetical protein